MDSGTAALALAIKSACVRNRLVALPAFACFDLATAADGADVRVVLYDVDADTLAPNRASLEDAIAQKPDAVVVVHLYGVPVDVTGVARAAADVGATTIEDAAQAFGTVIRGKRAGAIGDMGILSFGRGKGLSGGGGGALLAGNALAAERVNRIDGLARPAGRGYGEWARSSVQWLLARPLLYSVPASLPFLRLGETIYHEYGGARRMSRAARQMLQSNWTRSQEEVAVRQRNAARLRAAAEQSPRLQPIIVDADAIAGYLRFPVLVNQGDGANGVSAAAQQLGIMSSYPTPLSQLAGFTTRCINAEASFPGAERLAQSLVTLPTHSRLAESDLRALEEWLSSSA